jgi:hypothetical protein
MRSLTDYFLGAILNGIVKPLRTLGRSAFRVDRSSIAPTSSLLYRQRGSILLLFGRVRWISKSLVFPWNDTSITRSERVLTVETSVFSGLHEVLKYALDARSAANLKVIGAAEFTG